MKFSKIFEQRIRDNNIFNYVTHNGTYFNEKNGSRTDEKRFYRLTVNGQEIYKRVRANRRKNNG